VAKVKTVEKAVAENLKHEVGGVLRSDYQGQHQCGAGEIQENYSSPSLADTREAGVEEKLGGGGERTTWRKAVKACLMGARWGHKVASVSSTEGARNKKPEGGTPSFFGMGKGGGGGGTAKKGKTHFPKANLRFWEREPVPGESQGRQEAPKDSDKALEHRRGNLGNPASPEYSQSQRGSAFLAKVATAASTH